jgi:flagellar biogenesis protein FliO
MDSGAVTGGGLPLSSFSALFVLLLCAGALFLFWAWRFLRGRAHGLSKMPLELLGRCDLSPQHVLYVVKAADRCLLLGGAPGALSLLSELEPPESAATTAAGDDREELAA